MLRIATEEDVERLFRSETAVLYKHSPTWPLCLSALEEVETFAEQRLDVLFFLVDVRAQRSLSQQIAARVGVRHESPQVIVFRRGAPVWNASHSDVTSTDIARHVPTAWLLARAGYRFAPRAIWWRWLRLPVPSF
jgi:bacillithiol system protein YtxJ